MIFVIIFLGLSVLIIAHEFGHFFASKIFKVDVEEFGFGYPPRITGKKIGKTFWSINALPFGGFVKIKGEDSEEKRKNEEENQDKNNFSKQTAIRKSIIILAGVVMNVIIGFVIFIFVFMAGGQNKLVIPHVAVDSPAYSAGVRDGDVISKITSGKDKLTSFADGERLISFVKEHISNIIVLDVERGQKIYSYKIKPRENPPKGEGALGIELVSLGFKGYGFFGAVWKSIETTAITLWQVTGSFIVLFSTIFVEPSVIKNLAGPVGIFSVAEQAGSLGLTYLFQLIAIISLNLAVLNLIPFPALDGGRFLMIIIEKIKGSPVSKRTQQIVNSIGFIALIFLMVLVTVNDISRIVQ